MTRKVAVRDWKSAVSITAEITAEATPDASLELLLAADVAVLDAITHPYAQAGHAFDGQSTGELTDRQFGAMIAPGAIAARAYLSLWGQKISGSQSHYQIDTSSSGGIPSGANDVINVPSSILNGTAYADLGGTSQVVGHDISGDDDTTNPVASGPLNRRIELTETLAPGLEVIRIRDCAGFGLVVMVVSGDLE
jgi:hypothetical protein